MTLNFGSNANRLLVTGIIQFLNLYSNSTHSFRFYNTWSLTRAGYMDLLITILIFNAFWFTSVWMRPLYQAH